MQATARIFFQKAPARRTKNNLCPVKLCITHNRVRKYYSISEKIKDSSLLFVNQTDIDRIQGDSPRGKYRTAAFEYKRIADEAQAIINGLQQFSFNQFEAKFFKYSSTWDGVFTAFVDHIKNLRKEDRYGYASSFESTLRSVKEFHENKALPFTSKDKIEDRYDQYLSGKPLSFIDISPSWLKSFETWLLKHDKTDTTCGIYIRNIRTLFNLAIKDHQIKAEYPFEKYGPPSGEGRKIALTAVQISKIANYKTEHPKEQLYRDLFMFSFLGNGINIADIAQLRYSNIRDGEIWFLREKTKRSRKKSKRYIHVPITKVMQSIIERHGNKIVGFDSYIFPIFQNDWTDERNFKEKKQVTKLINKCLGRIASAVGIEEKISTYTARHSWATIAKNSGTSTEFIKESLGHSSVLVTEAYLESFEKNTRVKHSEKIETKIYKNKSLSKII